MTSGNSYSQLGFNLKLALMLAVKSMHHHRMVVIATLLGVATGMCVVSTILIVDKNTARTSIAREQISQEIEINQLSQNKNTRKVILPVTKIEIIKAKSINEYKASFLKLPIPTQIINQPLTETTRPTAKGEEDYQAMRLAIRMASLMAFFIGAVIVFYTMRFSVESRSREFALLLCLGESKKNVALSLEIEALVLGVLGSLLGMLAAFPASFVLLKMGISTTGRVPNAGFSIPYFDLIMMLIVSIAIAMIGVIAPIKDLYRFQISQVLQPRFVSDAINKEVFNISGYSWLLPAVLITGYIVVRPFLQSWLSVVYFFIFEGIFVVILLIATLLWTRPFLRFCIHLIELIAKPLFPLESLLTIKRIRLTSQKFVFSISGVVLVFSLLTSLHAITRSLKHEIDLWSSEAMTPYFFYKLDKGRIQDELKLQQFIEKNNIFLFRMSEKSQGVLPIRIIEMSELNRYRDFIGKPLLEKDQVIFSRTLAARFGAGVDDYLLMEANNKQYFFKIIDVSDEVGSVAEDGQYVDLKSYALFGDGNELFIDNLELSLGHYVAVRSATKNKSNLWHKYRYMLKPYYEFDKAGRNLKNWQLKEIDKDFLIFDFILVMTVILACIGIVNTLLIQVHARGRELSVLKTIGIDRMQMIRLLFVEGLVIGMVGAVLAILLGTILGNITVSFLDHFTLFHYQYVWSTHATIVISALAVLSCCFSAIYPAIVATRISTAESLHYE